MTTDVRKLACSETSRWSDWACPVLDDPNAEHNKACDRFARAIEARDEDAARYARSEAKTRKHSHYYKPCPFAEVDIYRVLLLFGVTDPCIQHAAKKLLVAGGRGAGKDVTRDIQEAIDTLVRWQEMRAEEAVHQEGDRA